MLDKFNDLNSKDKLTLICGAVFLVVMLFVLSTGFDGDIPKPVFKVNTEEVNALIDDLGDNYVITLTSKIGETESKYIHYYDGRFHLYESDKSEFGYLEYNNKRYKMDGVTKDLTEYDESVGFIDNPLYDYELVKNFTDNCNYEYVTENKASCKITLNEYLSYHNNKYNTSYVGSDSEYITIDVVYGSKLSLLTVDYTSYNKSVNLSDENLIVKFDIQYNVNNFDTIYDNYKDVLGE